MPMRYEGARPLSTAARCGYLDGIRLRGPQGAGLPARPSAFADMAATRTRPGVELMPESSSGSTRTWRRTPSQSEQVRDFVDALDVALWEADPDTRTCEWVNRRATELLGYSARTLVGERDFFRLYVEAGDVPKVSEVYDQVARTGEPREVEYDALDRDGRLLRLCERVRCVEDTAGGARLCGVIVDVTERRRLEERLRQAERTALVGRLASGIAHDFNNVLTVIQGNVQLALEALRADHPVREDLDEVKENARRAASLANQLLRFTRNQTRDPCVLDVTATVERMQKLLVRLIGEEVELVVDLAPDTGRVEADPAQIEQVVMNLAINARDAMPTGGRLRIATCNVDLDEVDTAGIDERVQPGPYVLLAISDTGMGMSPEVRERAFEPFFTTKRGDDGTGLGLATVYGIVKQSDGHITVESEPGGGSTFRTFLPRVDVSGRR